MYYVIQIIYQHNEIINVEEIMQTEILEIQLDSLKCEIFKKYDIQIKTILQCASLLHYYTVLYSM